MCNVGRVLTSVDDIVIYDESLMKLLFYPNAKQYEEHYNVMITITADWEAAITNTDVEEAT